MHYISAFTHFKKKRTGRDDAPAKRFILVEVFLFYLSLVYMTTGINGVFWQMERGILLDRIYLVQQDESIAPQKKL